MAILQGAQGRQLSPERSWRGFSAVSKVDFPQTERREVIFDFGG